MELFTWLLECSMFQLVLINPFEKDYEIDVISNKSAYLYRIVPPNLPPFLSSFFLTFLSFFIHVIL